MIINKEGGLMKKIIGLILLILVVLVLPGCSKVTFEYEDCWQHDGCIRIKQYTGNKKTFDIPETIESKQVCCVSGDVFEWVMYNKQMVNDIPESIVVIGAFDDYMYDYFDCEIEEGVVYYRNRVVNIDEKAVGSELIIREGTLSIAYKLGLWINEGKNIKYIYLPGSLKIIEDYIFNSSLCNVEEIYFGEGIEKIGHSSFSSCEKLKTIHFPSTLKSIGGFAFQKSPKSLDVYLPDSIVELSDYSFGPGGTFRISSNEVNPNWTDAWHEESGQSRFNIITQHNEKYFCTHCKGYTNDDYSGTGHKCICD